MEEEKGTGPSLKVLETSESSIFAELLGYGHNPGYGFSSGAFGEILPNPTLPPHPAGIFLYIWGMSESYTQTQTLTEILKTHPLEPSCMQEKMLPWRRHTTPASFDIRSTSPLAETTLSMAKVKPLPTYTALQPVLNPILATLHQVRDRFSQMEVVLVSLSQLSMSAWTCTGKLHAELFSVAKGKSLMWISQAKEISSWQFLTQWNLPL